jgi:hypothetical protein
MAHFGRAYRASPSPLSGAFLPRSFIGGEAVHDPKRSLSGAQRSPGAGYDD